MITSSKTMTKTDLLITYNSVTNIVNLLFISLLNMFYRQLSVCHAVLSVDCSLMVTCAERANLFALLNLWFPCVLSRYHVVSWVRCGA